jgi:hypothetical protein
MRSGLMFGGLRLYFLVLLCWLYSLGFNLKLLLSFDGLCDWLVLSRLMLHWLMLNGLVFNRLVVDRLMLNGLMLGDLLVLNRLNLMRFLLDRLCLFMLLFLLLSFSLLLLDLLHLFLLLLARSPGVFFIRLFELFRNISNSGPLLSVFLLLPS